MKQFNLQSLISNLLLIMLAILQIVFTQGGRFTSEAAVTFGQKVDFSLTAVTDLPLETITLFIQHAGAAAPFSANVPFTQAADGLVTAEQSFTPQQLGLPPFTTIRYWWEVETTAGSIIPVPPQTEAYQDDRFNWKRLLAEEGGTAVTIQWTGEEMETGGVAHQILQETLPRLNAILPLPPGTPLPIFLYPSSADLRAALRLNGYDWVREHVDPALGVVMVTAVNSKTARADLSRPLPHELAHFWLYQVAGSHYETIPPWFKEGLAVWLEGDESADGERVLATANPKLLRAVAQNSTIPLTKLCTDFPVEQAQLAYAQSAALVAFVQARYGEQALADLAAAFVAGEGCETAVPKTLGQSVAEFEAEWLAGVRPQSTAVQLLRENGLWLLLLLGGFAIMGLLIFWPKLPVLKT
jgi:hypothetical protein